MSEPLTGKSWYDDAHGEVVLLSDAQDAVDAACEGQGLDVEDAVYLADAAVHMADHMKNLGLYCEDADNVRHFAAKVLAAAAQQREGADYAGIPAEPGEPTFGVQYAAQQREGAG